MKIEITLTDEDTRKAQWRYLVNEGIILPEWKVTSHYPTLGQITFESEYEVTKYEEDNSKD